VIGNVSRSLRLLRAGSDEIPKLLEMELLEPWPIRRPNWFPLWARNNCSRLEQRLQQSSVPEPTSNAAAQQADRSSQPRLRLRPTHYSKAVETDRVVTSTVATQTDIDLVLQPQFLLQLLLNQTTRLCRPSTVPFMTLADQLLNLEPLMRGLDETGQDAPWLNTLAHPTVSGASTQADQTVMVDRRSAPQPDWRY
jgi:hypothetical protein